VHADGVADDSDALQKAINRVQETTRQGVVFIPEGRYRLGKTVYLWSGIRLIGYGKNRPVFVLGRDTPGFQQGAGRYMIFFADYRPPAGSPIADASEFTFYSGISNIDFELQEGNPAAIAVRFHVAQHSTLTHMDFHLGSARAAVEDIGNQASDIHIYGGQYGIITKKTSPAWQFLLMDSSFEGQSLAAIHTQEAGFTLVRDRFAHMPVALEIAEGQVEQLYGQDLEMEDIRKAALVLGNTENLRSEVTLENVACSDVPHFVEGAQPIAAPSKFYVEEHYSMGLDIGADGRERGILMHHKEHALSQPAPAVPSDIPALPPMESWVDVRSLGVKGDGGTDDTAALQAAIDKHPVLYVPSGMYRLTGSLRLRPDTALIGFNPATTQLTLLDKTAQFQGDGPPVPLLIAPHGGTNIVTGIGIATGLENPRAGGVLWMAGSKSLLEDVTFIPGHTFYVAALEPARPKPARFDRAKVAENFDSQNPDLWVKDGGGGIFRGLWTHNSFTHAGFRVENTSTPSRVYQLSCEHHIHVEVQLHHVQNWQIYDLQTEEEYPAGSLATAVEIQDSHHVTFANTYMYRVSRSIVPKTYAVTAGNSSDINFENVKVFSQTRLAFDNSVYDEKSGVAVRAHHFTHFAIEKGMKAPGVLPVPAGIFAKDAKLERLATGFTNASGLTADDAGHLYFTDAAVHKIYRWNEADKRAEAVAEIPGRPMVAGFVAPSSVLVVAYEKAVYSLPIGNGGAIQPVAETAEPAPHTALLLPVGLHNELSVLMDLLEHRGYIYRRGSNTAILGVVPNEHRGYFYAPGTNTALMAGGTWRPIVQSSQLAVFAPGEQRFVVSEDDARTYSAKLESDGKLTTRVFAERGGTSVVSDDAGNVYVASGEVYVYNSAGKQIGVLEVPERPGSLAFGGPDHHTLFIGARGSLYAIRTASAGR
jgi:Pectate lyase superfamily protein/SMP-30/Gluconolactonase/LRE-like region